MFSIVFIFLKAFTLFEVIFNLFTYIFCFHGPYKPQLGDDNTGHPSVTWEPSTPG